MIEIEQTKSPIYIEKLEANSEKLVQVASTYARVFAGWPWFEISRGPKCDNFYGQGLLPGNPCPCGCGNLEKAYPVKETVDYINQELSKPMSVGQIAKLGDNIIAFGWGYELTGEKFAKTKYKLPENQDLLEKLVGKDRVYFYISEVGVIPEAQGKKLGTKITTYLFNSGVLRSLPLLMRTNIISPMAIIAKNLGMIAIVSPNLNFSDQENPERVIFVKI